MAREIKYLSPTSIALYEQDKEAFYIQYISDNHPPRDPQLQVMSIGSALDAYVKNYLHESLFGKEHKDSNKFKFETIFEAQVEKHNRDWAREHGKYCFEQYKGSGALADLMLELQKSSGEPRFEFDVQGVINGFREGIENTLGEVTLLGKPDVSFITEQGAHVVLDFKVNGYCSTYNTSPVAGYVRLRGAGKTNYGAHKDAFIIEDKGIKINCATTFDVVKKDWAQQLAIYSWLCGSPVGSDFIIAVDQLVCNYNKGGLPNIKIAEHRMKIDSDWQRKLFTRICDVWECCQSDWFFRDMNREDSIERCKLLDGRAFVIENDNDQWLDNVTKKQRFR